MKKGMSSVIVVIMIVLLVIMSVSIIWKFVSPMFGEDLEVLEEVVDMRLVADEGYTSWDVANRLVEVQVMRGVDDIEIVGFGLLFTIDGDTVTHYVDEVLGFNMKKTYYINLSNYSGELESIGLVPVFLGGRIGEVISELKYYNIVGSELGGLSPEGGFVAPASSVPSGGGGGSSTITPVVEEPVVNCTENWSCSDWSDCVGDLRTRTCSDANSCGTVVDRPVLSEGCSSVECVVDGDCEAGEYCNSGNCVPVGSECSEDSDCVYRGPGFVCNSGNVCEWEPPIGIPVPSFGIEESYRMYDNVSNRNPALTYTVNSEGGFYTHYVDNSGACTDSGNDYGNESNPRCTIPKDLSEGSVVEIHGSIYSPAFLLMQNTQGEKEKPIFIRGVGMPRINTTIEISYYGNAQYVIYEGLDFRSVVLAARSSSVSFETNNVCLRHSNIGDQGGLGIASYNENNLTNIVIYNVSIHERGEWDPEIAVGDKDWHCIGVGNGVNNLWIVDGEMHHCEGDGLQINSNPTRVSYNIYVGRNLVHHNKQSGLWTKYARNIVFSQNTIHSIKESSSAPGPGMGFQHGPRNVWFLFNKIYNAENGFVTGSASGPGYDGDGIYSYFIGNELYNIYHTSEEWNPIGTPDCIQGSAFCLRGGPQRYLIGNTIVNFDGGISALSGGSGTSRTHMVNNIMVNRSNVPYSHHLRFDDRSGDIAITNSDIDNNLFFQSGNQSCIITNTNYMDCKNLTTFKTLFGNCLNCTESDPEFIDFENYNFKLRSTSPAIDAGKASGVVDEVFDRYQTLFGIDIRKDIEDKARPQGSEWDIGAYEY